MRLLSLLLVLLVSLLIVDARARFASGDLYIASESSDGVPLEAPSLFDILARRR